MLFLERVTIGWIGAVGEGTVVNGGGEVTGEAVGSVCEVGREFGAGRLLGREWELGSTVDETGEEEGGSVEAVGSAGEDWSGVDAGRVRGGGLELTSRTSGGMAKGNDISGDAEDDVVEPPGERVVLPAAC